MTDRPNADVLWQATIRYSDGSIMWQETFAFPPNFEERHVLNELCRCYWPPRGRETEIKRVEAFGPTISNLPNRGDLGPECF